MRTSVIAATIAVFALVSPAGSAPAMSQQQTSKYTLIVVANGSNDGDKRDGVAMMTTGIYLTRSDCEAAGGGIQFGAVGGAADAKPSTSITWICVPLGKP